MRTVLVTGATGRQGGAVLRHMRGKGWTLRAMTRNAGGPAARGLAQDGIEVVEGDLDDPASIERAARGVYGVYSVQNYWTVGATREVQQGKNVADAARKAGVAHLVYSSVGGAERNSGIEHWDTKFEIERYIRGLGLPATIIRPVAFMDKYADDQVATAIFDGQLLDPIRPDKTFQTIASDDIGAFVALAFDRPEQFIGLELEIAGSELTNPDAAAVFSRVLGRPVAFQQVPMDVVRSWGHEYEVMFRWFNGDGFNADIAALRRTYPEVRLRTLEDWLREEGWDKRAMVPG